MRLPHLRVPNVPVYDKGVHEKLLSASFQFCEQYAVEFAASLAEGGAGGGQGEGTGKGTARARKGGGSSSVKGRAKGGAKTAVLAGPRPAFPCAAGQRLESGGQGNHQSTPK